jgi:quercetin dioxygenase-like cupin family protein
MSEDKTMSTNDFPELMRAQGSAIAFSSPEPGLKRRVLAHNASMMLVEHRMESGWIGARHAHTHDQMVYVIRGRIRFVCLDQTFEASAGDSFVLRGGIDHQAAALETSVVLDVFTPYREDFLPPKAESHDEAR